MNFVPEVGHALRHNLLNFEDDLYDDSDPESGLRF